MGAYSDRIVREHNLTMSAAFYGAAWANGAKIRLKDVLVRQEDAAPPAEATTPDTIKGAMDAWVIATGGTLDEPKPRRRRRKVRQ